jgi:hypothetical protein
METRAQTPSSGWKPSCTTNTPYFSQYKGTRPPMKSARSRQFDDIEGVSPLQLV